MPHLDHLARCLTAAGVLLACTAAATSCSRARRAEAPKADVPHVTVMTYNVNYGLAGDADTIDVIRDADAGVVFLQETTASWEGALRAELADRYEHMAFRHCCGAGGLAVLSKYSFEEADYLEPPEDGWFPAWRVLVDSPVGELQVLAVHLHPSVSNSGSVLSGYFTAPPIRRDEIAEYYPALDPSLPTLVVGDLNESDAGRAVSYLEDRGFRTALPEFAGREPTWRWNTRIGPITAQLDHILYDSRLEPLSARVIQGGRSDHYPVVATFERAPVSAAPSPPRACSGSTSTCP